MVGNMEPLSGSNEKLHILSLDSVKPNQPCVDTAPTVNEDKLKQYFPLAVTLGELYESVLPEDLFTDVVSTLRSTRS